MVLVTGGTGLVGAHLLLQLVEDKELVRAIYRTEESLNAVKKCFTLFVPNPDELFNKIEWVKADITNVPELMEAFVNVTYVYHCAAKVSFNPSEFESLKKTNIEGTANVVNLCLSHDIKKLCYVSSIATLGSTLHGEVITEEAHWNNEAKNSVYAITKYGAELEVWRGTQEGLIAVIVNPGVIIGSGFYNAGSGALIEKIDKGLTYYTQGTTGFVGVKDVVKAMTMLMQSPIINERFILVSENLSYQNFFNEIAKYLDTTPPKRKASKFLLQLAWRIDWFTSYFFGAKRTFTKSMARTALTLDTYSASKIINSLDFNFQPMSTVIKNTCEKYKLVIK